MGKGGRIQDDGVKSFPAAVQTGQGLPHVLFPKAMVFFFQLVTAKVLATAFEGAGRGVDIQGGGPNGASQDTEGASVGKEVEQGNGTAGTEEGTVFPLVGKKAGGGAWGEINTVAQAQLLHLESPTLTA
jgi:hypothetical protein